MLLIGELLFVVFKMNLHIHFPGREVQIEFTANSFGAFRVGHLTTIWKRLELSLFSALTFSRSNSLLARKIANT
jgi:hypothetical protein